jgi:acetyl-CoA carboxylase biotin carboxylase subunit
VFRKILIANRGEIACRVTRTARRLGVRTVAVYSEADRRAMHVALADEAVLIGPPAARESYLNGQRIVEAARQTGAEAVHPGYGFLSENAEFAELWARSGLVFIGPPAAAIRAMGGKAAAKTLMQRAGVPVVPGYHGDAQEEELLAEQAARIGYPVLIKAVAGGGGRGMKVIDSPDAAEEAFTLARQEATAAFGNGSVYVEKYLGKPRHIEIQILADTHGNCVHLGERDCSLQRRHQKVLEETPSPALNRETRARIGDLAAKAIGKMGYRGAGTLEFLYQDGEFYFIEMNTRLQVEHPITEAITGIDLVREQIRVAAGAPLGFTQADVKFSGHAIECRVNAENPETFVPCPGLVTDYHPPGGLGVRVDSGLYTGYRMPPYYDSLVAKLIVSGGSRNECLMRLRRALGEYVIGGIETTIPLHQRIIAQQEFVDGEYDIHWLERLVGLKK